MSDSVFPEFKHPKIPELKHPGSDIRMKLGMTGFPHEPLHHILSFDIEALSRELMEEQEAYVRSVIDMLGIDEEEFVRDYFIEHEPPAFRSLNAYSFDDNYAFKVENKFRIRPKRSAPELFPDWKES